MSLIEKIKLLFAVKGPVTKLANDVKKITTGWKTLGFWVTTLGSAISVATAVTGFIPVTTALIVSTTLTVAYNVLRAFQNAGVDGVTPVMQSTRFITTVVGIVSAGLLSLQTGGVNPQWITASISVLAAVGAAAQALGAQGAQPQPK